MNICSRLQNVSALTGAFFPASAADSITMATLSSTAPWTPYWLYVFWSCWPTAFFCWDTETTRVCCLQALHMRWNDSCTKNFPWPRKKNYSCGVTTGKWSVPAIHLCLPLPPPPWACLRSPAAVFASSTTQVCFRLPSCLISATFFKAVGYLGNSRSSIT